MAKESALARLPNAGKAAIIAIVLIMLAAAYWLLLYGEVSQKISAARQQEVALKNDLAEAKKVHSAYQRDLAELHEREERKTEIEKVLPTEAQYPSFLSSIQAAANMSGVALTAWTPENEVSGEFYARVPMKLQMRGRYHQIAKFFYSVARLERIINMENISIREPKIEGDEILVTCTALATAFRSLPQEASKRTKEAKEKRPRGSKKK